MPLRPRKFKSVNTLKKLSLALITAATLTLPACSDDGDTNITQVNAPTTSRTDVVTNYLDLMHANFSDAEVLVLDLQASVNAFVANPTDAGFQDCKAKWLRARPFYQQSEVSRFHDGPIDRAPDGPEGQINAWPLDESFIDSVQGNANAGIINMPTQFPVIDSATLIAQYGNGGDENVSTGWHAIEFLLWGQDLTAPSANMPGQRPFTDYTTATNADRRRTYLTVAVDLLLADIRQVKNEYAPGGAFRTELGTTNSTNEALGRILTGAGFLAFGELRSERILVPFTTQLQEDEHSCFSDTTQLDHLHDMIGVRNVWFGNYTPSDNAGIIDGPGFRDLAMDTNATLAAEIDALLNRIIQRLKSPNVIPFDNALTSPTGRAELQLVIDDLDTLNTKFNELAATLGITIRTS